MSLARAEDAAESPVGWSCSLDMRGANKRLREAEAARKGGDLAAARVALVEALRLHPAIRRSYDAVGALLVDMGLPEAAEQCFRGVLPACVSREWFNEPCVTRAPDRIVDKAEPFDQATHVQGVERHVCFTPVERKIKGPRGVVPPVDRMFTQRCLTTTLAFVDRIENGSLWFDNFNRAVIDADGNLVDHHTRGNPALVLDRTRGSTPAQVAGRAFFVGNRGSGNYYHWMLDILPSFHLFEKAGYSFRDSDRVIVFNGSNAFQRSTLAALGFGPDRVIELERGSPWVQADELVVPFYMNAMAKTMGDWVPAFLRSCLAGDARTPTELAPQLPAWSEQDVKAIDSNDRVGTESSPTRKIYLARSEDARNARSIANETDMIEHLESRGFEILHPERLTVREQAMIFSSADTILAAHGAALTNIVFCKPGTRIVELYGEYMETCYWVLSEICELDYYNHRCEAVPSDTDFHRRSHKEHHALRRQGFAVDLGELDALLDLALTDTGAFPADSLA